MWSVYGERRRAGGHSALFQGRLCEARGRRDWRRIVDPSWDLSGLELKAEEEEGKLGKLE
jgi:hypothetical protein